MICAYCGEEKKGTKEHIISKAVLDLFPECNYTINEMLKVMYLDEPMIKDVCAECNNRKISYIDNYAKEFIKKYFTKEYEENEKLNIEYNYSLIQKMFLKYAYNDLRVKKEDTSFFTEDIKHYLMDENIVEPLKNVTVLAGLAINTSPMPLDMAGNKKIEWASPLLFVSNCICCFNRITGESEMEKEKFKTIDTAYIFRFYTGQFILICWNGEEADIIREKKIIENKYPYRVLSNNGIITLQRCTGYLNYHNLQIVDTVTGLRLQDEMSYCSNHNKEYKK